MCQCRANKRQVSSGPVMKASGEGRDKKAETNSESSPPKGFEFKVQASARTSSQLASRRKTRCDPWGKLGVPAGKIGSRRQVGGRQVRKRKWRREREKIVAFWPEIVA